MRHTALHLLAVAILLALAAAWTKEGSLSCLFIKINNN
jgi:hypothetical protein